MIVAAKQLGVLLQPDNLLVFWLAVSVVLLWTPWRRLGRGMTSLGVVALVLCGLFPLGRVLALPLETRFAAPRPMPEAVEGIILLGGNIRSGPARPLQPDHLANVSQHLFVFAELARLYPTARLVFTGGAPPHIANAQTEADAVRPILAALGMGLDRVIFEQAARNTQENAVNSKQLVRPRSDERWLLIASALHMPRAIAVFQAVDWPVIPYPVDLPPAGAGGGFFSISVAGNLTSLKRVSHEWLGLLWYRLNGLTRELLPA